MLKELKARNPREGKDLQKINSKQMKMVIGSHTAIITLNVNGLNASTKRHRLTGWMKNLYACPFTYHITLFNPSNCM